ncbi:type IV toxin-antitoxin system AbiEi family antitoxin domain-containing protein [Nocardioides sp. CFH 31398]|uniref:type IV toxin-antitoxin system AbiEi family antitoxin domain-containing protein n=1 Tax=Nocardioides sp. CFH 31398 TaxID=2919579 RepID=UPI001F0582F9|nr:type IV toxin-antitoxin system AbiEi family antitoxin domain-containing protein [Nocardioides sp. CFH 31398]MCH1865441.1 type IV toxin-antitoxin system AbiEi family antitoxin domain-containing protein [Nocardioides sp. CFH 31398]
MDVAEVVARLGGVARTDQLLRHVTARALTEAVRAGRVERLSKGHYGLPALAATHRAAARLDATITCLSAAVEQGWEVLQQPDRPWLAVPRNRKVELGRRRGVNLTWTGHGATVTSPVTTVLECARRLPFPEALAVADSALRHGVVDLDELQVAAARVRGPGSPAVSRVATRAHPSSRNPLESALRALSLEVPGLALVPQVPVTVDGIVIHPDLVDERLRLVVEAEGWLYHGGPEQFAHDLWRYTALTVDGWTVVRFGHRAVTTEWVVECLESLERTCRRRTDCRRCA